MVLKLDFESVSLHIGLVRITLKECLKERLTCDFDLEFFKKTAHLGSKIVGVLRFIDF